MKKACWIRFCIQKLNIMHVLYAFQLVYVKMVVFFVNWRFVDQFLDMKNARTGLIKTFHVSQLVFMVI